MPDCPGAQVLFTAADTGAATRPRAVMRSSSPGDVLLIASTVLESSEETSGDTTCLLLHAVALYGAGLDVLVKSYNQVGTVQGRQGKHFQKPPFVSRADDHLNQ